MTQNIKLDEEYALFLEQLRKFDRASTSTAAIRTAIREALQNRNIWPAHQVDVVHSTEQEKAA